MVLIGRVFRTLHARRFCRRKSRFTDSQLLVILKQAEGGVPVLVPAQNGGQHLKFKVATVQMFIEQAAYPQAKIPIQTS